MTTKSAITLAALLAASGLIAGCDYGAPASASTRQDAAVRSELECARVVDPAGYNQGPLTTNLAVAYLTDTRLAGAAGIASGRPAHAVTRTLDSVAVELMGYSGNKLSDDAQAYALAEENYNPDGPVDTSYARTLDGSILALQRDCPDGMKLGDQWRSAGPYDGVPSVGGYSGVPSASGSPSAGG
jgi:hypothetical protein